MSIFHDFRVNSPIDLITAIPGLQQAAVCGIPDHALLTWKIATDFPHPQNCIANDSSSANCYNRFDLSNVPGSFMTTNECMNFIHTAISRLEQSHQDQQDIDSVYNNWCQFVKQTMYLSVPYKRVSTGYTTKRHKPRKPWWNSTLTDLWSRLSQAERSWLKSRGGSSEKARLKSAYVTLCKSFDREVQRYKRLHWYNLQSELEQECNIDHTRFWKSIGKIGVKSAKRNLIPCEIITNDGSVSQETDEVLNK